MIYCEDLDVGFGVVWLFYVLVCKYLFVLCELGW